MGQTDEQVKALTLLADAVKRFGAQDAEADANDLRDAAQALLDANREANVYAGCVIAGAEMSTEVDALLHLQDRDTETLKGTCVGDLWMVVMVDRVKLELGLGRFNAYESERVEQLKKVTNDLRRRVERGDQRIEELTGHLEAQLTKHRELSERANTAGECQRKAETELRREKDAHRRSGDELARANRGGIAQEHELSKVRRQLDATVRRCERLRDQLRAAGIAHIDDEQ